MTKNITIHNITYHIYTEKEEGYYFGCWRNMTTGDEGESSKACNSENEAMEMSENNAKMDYKFKYGSKPPA